jgi:hypothetical protein
VRRNPICKLLEVIWLDVLVEVEGEEIDMMRTRMCVRIGGTKVFISSTSHLRSFNIHMGSILVTLLLHLIKNTCLPLLLIKCMVTRPIILDQGRISTKGQGLEVPQCRDSGKMMKDRKRLK